MINTCELVVKIKLDKKAVGLVDRACKALTLLGQDGLVVGEDVDMIIKRVETRIMGMVTFGKVKRGKQ